MLTVQSITVTPFQQNARIITNSQSGLTVIVDPGGEIERILEFIDFAKFRVEAILLTHSHIDHCAGVRRLLDILASAGQARPLIYAGAESDLRSSITQQALFFGLDSRNVDNCPEPDILLVPGQKLQLCKALVEARFTPGHSPGHYSFVFPEATYKIIEAKEPVGSYLETTIKTGIVVSGDTLFRGSIGRTDFPGSSSEMLLGAIRTQLFTLPDSTVVLPGHGPMTTIGTEKRTNPFLQ